MRALTVDNILTKKRSYIQWTNSDFEQAFAQPEDCGVWFIWGNSGSGKSSFLMELIKALSVCGKIVFNSLEEGDSIRDTNEYILETGDYIQLISDVPDTVFYINAIQL
jgi:adenylylsulfate kinase-like enzyme